MKIKKVLWTMMLVIFSLILSVGFMGCTPAEDPGPALTPTITLNKTEKSMEIFSTFQLEATTEHLDGVQIVWTSSDSAVASVDDEGLVTAKADGVATITATAGEVSASCSIIVTNSHAIPQLLLNQPSSMTLPIGESFTIVANTKYQQNNVPNVNYVWSLSSGDEQGVVTLTPSADTKTVTVEGVKFGNVTVNCAAICNGVPVRSTVKVKVYNDDVAMSVSGLTEGVNGYQVAMTMFSDAEKGYINEYAPTLTVTENETAVDASQITWTSSDDSVVAYENGKIVAKGLGNAKVLAFYNGNGVYFDVVVGTATFEIADTIYVEFAEEDSFVLPAEVGGNVLEVYYNGADIFDSYNADDGIVKIRTANFNGFGIVNGGLRIVTDLAEYVAPTEYVAMIINDADEFCNMPNVAWELGDKTPEVFRVSHPTLGGIFYLGNDIDMAGKVYNRVYNATGWAMLGGFVGTFDGKGYNVDNLTMPSGGIFNYIAHDGVFKNVTFTNAVLDATSAIALQKGFITDWCNGKISNVYVHLKEVKIASEAYTFYGGAHTSEPVISNVMIVADKLTNTAGGTVKFYGVGFADSVRSYVGNVVNSVFVTGEHDGVTTVTGSKDAGVLEGVESPAELVETTASSLTDLTEVQDNWDNKFWTVKNGIPVPSSMLEGNAVEIKNEQTYVGIGKTAISATGNFVAYKLDATDPGITLDGNVITVANGVKNVTFTVTAYAVYDESICDSKQFAVPDTQVIEVEKTLYAEVTDVTEGVTLARTKNASYRTGYAYTNTFAIDLTGVEYDGTVSGVIYDGANVEFSVNEKVVSINKSVFGNNRGLTSVDLICEVKSGEEISKYVSITVPVYVADYVISDGYDFQAMPYVTYTLGKDIDHNENTETNPFLAGHVVLASNIEMKGIAYDSVYVHNDRKGGFRGVLDGDGHIVNELTINGGKGIFSAMLGSSELCNIAFTNGVFNATGAWGGYITTQRNAKFTNIYVHLAEMIIGGNGNAVFCQNNFNPALPVDNVVSIIDKLSYTGGYTAGVIYAGGAIYHEKLDTTGVGNRLYDQVVVCNFTSATEQRGWYTQPASGNTFTKPANAYSQISVEAENWDSTFWTVSNGIPVPNAIYNSTTPVEITNAESEVEEGELVINAVGDMLVYTVSDALISVKNNVLTIPIGYSGEFTVTAACAYDANKKDTMTFTVQGSGGTVIPPEPANTIISYENMTPSTFVNSAYVTDTAYVKDGTKALKITLTNNDFGWSHGGTTCWGYRALNDTAITGFKFWVYTPKAMSIRFDMSTGGAAGTTWTGRKFSKSNYALVEGWNEVTVLQSDFDGLTFSDGIVQFFIQVMTDATTVANNDGTVIYVDGVVAITE